MPGARNPERRESLAGYVRTCAPSVALPPAVTWPLHQLSGAIFRVSLSRASGAAAAAPGGPAPRPRRGPALACRPSWFTPGRAAAGDSASSCAPRLGSEKLLTGDFETLTFHPRVGCFFGALLQLFFCSCLSHFPAIGAVLRVAQNAHSLTPLRACNISAAHTGKRWPAGLLRGPLGPLG